MLDLVSPIGETTELNAQKIEHLSKTNSELCDKVDVLEKALLQTSENRTIFDDINDRFLQMDIALK
jgi:hypothetical protein